MAGCDASDTPTLPLLNLAGNVDGKSYASAATPLVLAVDPRPVVRLWELAEAESVLPKGKPD